MLNVSSISKQAVILQKQETIISDMDGDTVMMSIKNNKYYNLGSVGGIIWNKLLEPITIENLINDLTSEFEIEKENCEKQVLSFLESLYEENLIELK
jgi:hypothetical protein